MFRQRALPQAAFQQQARPRAFHPDGREASRHQASALLLEPGSCLEQGWRPQPVARRGVRAQSCQALALPTARVWLSGSGSETAGPPASASVQAWLSGSETASADPPALQASAWASALASPRAGPRTAA